MSTEQVGGEEAPRSPVPMPRTIGRYRVRGVLGSGAFATVYRALDEALDDEIAIKVLADNWARDPDVRARFISEARLIRRLQSGHVIRVLDMGETNGQPYFVMELADRGTLADRLDARPSRTIAALLPMARTLAAAMTVLHREGIVHRDLKPANILIKQAERPPDAVDPSNTSAPTPPLIERDEMMVLSDFGLAKDLVAASGLTISAGTPGYTAPEQLDPMSNVDHRADLHAASAVLVEIVTGRPPVGGPRPLDDEQEAMLGGTASVLTRSLRPDPEERPVDAAAWLDEIEAVIEALEPPDPSPSATDSEVDTLEAEAAAPTNEDDDRQTDRQTADGDVQPRREVDGPPVGPGSAPGAEAADPVEAPVATRAPGARVLLLSIVVAVAVLLGAAYTFANLATSSDQQDETTAAASTTVPQTAATTAEVDEVPPDTVPADVTPATTADPVRLGDRADTPIICSDHRGEVATIAPGATGVTLAASCTITTPVPGDLLVVASATVLFGSPLLDLPGEAATATLSLVSQTGAVSDTELVAGTDRTVSIDEAKSATPVTISGAVEVEPGSVTVALALAHDAGGQPVLGDPSLTAVFVPSGSALVRSCSDTQTRPLDTTDDDFGTDSRNLAVVCDIDAPEEGVVVVLASGVASSPTGQATGGIIAVQSTDQINNRPSLGQRFVTDETEQGRPVALIDARPLSAGRHRIGLFAANQSADGPAVRVGSSHLAALWIASGHPSVTTCSATDRKALSISGDAGQPLARCRLPTTETARVAAFGAATLTADASPWAELWFEVDGTDRSAGGASRLADPVGEAGVAAGSMSAEVDDASPEVVLLGRTEPGRTVEVENPGLVAIAVAPVEDPDP
ncbi:MAG: protein kinase [Actinomycetota bacterium]